MNTKIFAHRGAAGYAPENTLEAFELAVKMGAHGIELDVHISKDGELVVTHDERIERVSNGFGYVKDLTLRELKALVFNRTHPEYLHAKIPTLKEVLELIASTDLGINIELKNSLIEYPDLERRVVELAAGIIPIDRIIFSSFNHQSMARMKELDPQLYCGLLYEASLIQPWKYVEKLQMNALHPHYSQVITPGGFCSDVHDVGLQVNTWTVDEEQDIHKTLKEGVDILITNYPDRALKLLSDHETD